MGDTQSKSARNSSINEQQIFANATNMTRLLKLYQSDQELRQQRHLIARILLYGHDHVITHLKTFPREKQLEYIRYLRTIDYETIDLLYQNLVVGRIRGEKKKMKYRKVSVKDKKQQLNIFPSKYQSMEQVGKMLLAQKKVGIIICVGGSSSRFRDHTGKIVPKQFYKEKQSDKCLLEIMIEKLIKVCEGYGKQNLYLVHNETNHRKVNQILGKYQNQINFKKMLQDQMPIINLSGKLCIKKQSTFHFHMAPNGCGNFLHYSVRNKKLKDDLQDNGCEYVYTVGISNLAEQVCDPYVLGLLAEKEDCGVAYKCTYPDNEGENMSRVVYNESQKSYQVSQLEQLVEKTEKQHIWDIRRSFVFMNSVYFKVTFLQNIIKKGNQKLGTDSIIFTPKKSKCDFWNPSVPIQQYDQHCYIFERQLGDLFVTGNSHALGVLVPREEQFIPIISLSGQKKWHDAFDQMEYSQTKLVVENSLFTHHNQADDEM